MGRVIQVFEHERLPIGKKGISNTEFHALARFNERNGGKYFRIGSGYIKFAQYVGVIQVGRLTLEILPKADAEGKSKEGKGTWQRALVEMLRECRHLKVDARRHADLNTHRGNLLELYLQAFMDEVEALLRAGLAKQYRRQGGNILAVRGRIKFREHLRHNAVHRERVFTEHSVYDRRNPVNGILRAALDLVPTLCSRPHLVDHCARLRFSFDDIPPLPQAAKALTKLKLNRKLMPYSPALELASLLLNNLHPDLRGGNSHVLALVFDMNRLFEDYLFRQVRKAASEIGLWVELKPRKLFWESPQGNRSMEPDIVVHGGGRILVLDAKWKLPGSDAAGIADLRQLFAYRAYWKAESAALVYPWVQGRYHVPGKYSLDGSKGAMLFPKVLDSEGRLNKMALGREVLREGYG